MARLEVPGIAVSPGRIAAPVWLLQQQADVAEAAGGNAVSVQQAVARARGELAALAAASSPAAAAILGFQIAVLDDETLIDEIHRRMASGLAASEAWSAALQDEIAALAGAASDTFRARAADLEDVRDRVASLLSGAGIAVRPPRGTIIVARRMTPSLFIGHDWEGGGLVVSDDVRNGHVAVLARQFGVPVMTGSLPDGLALDAALPGEHALLDIGPESGVLKLSPGAGDALVSGSPGGLSGTHGAAAGVGLAADPRLFLNVARLEDLARVDPHAVAGIGLVRTEFLFAGRPRDEDSQCAAYVRLVEWCAGRPLAIRTFDEGGDKPSPEPDGRASGLRGIAASLAAPDAFLKQVRALLRAAAYGPLSVTLPLVTAPSELAAVRALFAEEAAALTRSGTACRLPPIGIMVETLEAAGELSAYAAAAHFAIGSNDLGHALAATGGDRSAAALIERVAAIAGEAARMGRPVSLCGDLAADPAMAGSLIAAGVGGLSVPPPALGLVASALAAHDAAMAGR
jgi:phosphoenolpyruvate-protein phosphotransferase (PTS system enzyme I)